MKASKSSKRITAKKSLKSKANASSISEKGKPNAGIFKSIKKEITYAAMWKAIQLIASPLSFESLKRFYNMEESAGEF